MRLNFNNLIFAGASALILCAPLAAASKSKSAQDKQKVEYVSGTPKAIPESTSGVLDLTDAKAMHFRFAKKSDFTLPYTQITASKETEKAPGKLAKWTKVPKLVSHKNELVMISYQDDKGVKGVLNFEMTKTQAATT